MKELLIAEKIDQIENSLYRVLKYLRAAQITDMAKYLGTYEQLVSDASIILEKSACAMRHLIYNTTSEKKSALMSRAAKAHNIQIYQTGQWLRISMPLLISKKKHHSGEFISDPLFCALSEYFLIHKPEPLEHCVVCFRHIYDKNLPERRMRDYDNLEEKQILDVIALFAMVDDTGSLCDVVNKSAKGEFDQTEIYVMDPEQFPAWYYDYMMT